MLINDILCVYMLIVCRFCFIITMFMRERSNKTMIPCRVLAIIKALVYFYVVLLSVLKPKITETILLTLFWFCKLASCW
jgi:hypothetical protein